MWQVNKAGMEIMMGFDQQVYEFIKALQAFEYRMQNIDRLWNVIFIDQKDKWHHLLVTQYHETYYINLLDGDICSLEVQPNKSVKAMASFGFSMRYEDRESLPGIWSELIAAAQRWLKVVTRDWIKANKQVQANYPLNRRKGIVPHAVVRASLKDCYRMDQVLGKAKTKQFIQLVESDYFHCTKNTELNSMSANDFFHYCKIAYTAVMGHQKTFDQHASGRKLYERYADGRDNGLLSINGRSKKEFSQWLDREHPKYEEGGHPWEIMRGGNTTHIDLMVIRPSYSLKEKFKVMLCGPAITRLKETICMFLAIYEAGLPITIDNPEGIRRRLLAQDNIGIMPGYDTLHRANQSFYEHEDVYDVSYFDDFGRYKPRIKSFVTWEPLPILKPKYRSE